MTARRPSVLAYRAVRDAETTEEARRVYDAVKGTRCHTGDSCDLDGDCPFYVDCLLSEGASGG